MTSVSSKIRNTSISCLPHCGNMINSKVHESLLVYHSVNENFEHRFTVKTDDLEKSNLNSWYEVPINIQCRYFTSAAGPARSGVCVYVYRGRGAQLSTPFVPPLPSAPTASADCGKSIALRAPQNSVRTANAWATTLPYTVWYFPFTSALTLNFVIVSRYPFESSWLIELSNCCRCIYGLLLNFVIFTRHWLREIVGSLIKR